MLPEKISATTTCRKRSNFGIKWLAPELIGTLLLTLLSLACSGVSSGGGNTTKTGVVLEISVSPTSATVASTGTRQFTATVTNSRSTSVTWSASLGSISNGGLFTAPAVTANTTVTVTATSVADMTKTATAAVTVTPPGVAPLVVTTTTVPSATSGIAYSANLSATGGTSPYSWTLASGQLPSGISLNASSISGTTTQIGQFDFTVRATDSASPPQGTNQSLTLVVDSSSGVAPLVVTTTTVPSATTGTAYSANLSATGGTPPYTWTLASGQLPSGVNLTASSISGTTTLIGRFDFTVRATDSASPSQGTSQSLTLVVDSSSAGIGLSANFFALHWNLPNTPFPSVSIGGERLWDSGVSWALVNTAQGVYDWTALDKRLADAQTHQVDLLYDLARTPVWAQCTPSSSSSCVQTSGCAFSIDTWGGGPGQCYWPGDLNPDGTGTNLAWQNWITAVATHSVNSGTAHIKYYEIWNEPNDAAFWRGTTAQLVRMTKDAACIIKGTGTNCNRTAIDPDALIVTPPPTYGGANINTWMADFLGQGGAQFSDVIGFHGYNGANAEKILTVVNTLRTGSLATYNQNDKLLFDTEFSWSENVTFPDPDEQAGFVARAELLHWSAGVDRLYWYAWDLSGTMWSLTSTPGCTTPDPSGTGFTCKSGTAFAQVQDWMVGATITQACSATGTVWTCGFTKPGGYLALAVWDTAQSCNNGSCTTSTYTIPASANYIHYRDLSGGETSIGGSTVQVGSKPILLENQ